MEQQKEVQVEEGISLVDIFKLLLSRIKLLIVVVLIAGIAGGAFAVFRTHDINYYGTTAQFYVNPRKTDDTTTDSEYGVYGTYSASVMDGIVKLLNSESFTEQLLLNNQPLPALDIWATAEEEEKLSLNAKILQGRADIAEVETRQTELVEKKKLQATKSKEMADAYEALTKAWVTEYQLNPDVFKSPTFNENVYFTVINASDAYADLKTAYGYYQGAKDAYDVVEKDIQTAQEAIKEPKKQMSASVETALNAWRKTAKYKSALARYKAPISFTYVGEGESLDEVNNRARSFIYVHINVLEDKEFAEELFEVVKNVVPEYVENNMPQINGFNETNCQRITRNDDIHLTNPRYTTNQAIKYGILAAVASFVVVCLILILLDRSDKRLRDVDVVTKKFNLPVLGVIPNLEEIEQLQKKDPKTQKKDAKKTTEVK